VNNKAYRIQSLLGENCLIDYNSLVIHSDLAAFEIGQLTDTLDFGEILEEMCLELEGDLGDGDGFYWLWNLWSTGVVLH
jgi:hypothetical protein